MHGAEMRKQLTIRKLQDCAHFHYDQLELNNLTDFEIHLVTRVCNKSTTMKHLNRSQRRKCSQTKHSGKHNQQQRKTSVCSSESSLTNIPECKKPFTLLIRSKGQSFWTVNRTYEEFRFLDFCLHLCCFSRDSSRLREIPIQCPGLANSPSVIAMLDVYLKGFSNIFSNRMNCSSVLNWLQMDNKGNKLAVGVDDSPVNIPAKAAAAAVRSYRSRALDELSFEPGAMISVIDMPPVEESQWWRGKRVNTNKGSIEVGFFPSDCVRLIGHSDTRSEPGSYSNASRTASHKAVRTRHGKLVTFLRTFFSSRPSRIVLKQVGIVKERVFGCDLGEHLLNIDRSLPRVLEICCEFIENHGVVDGIYRLNGSFNNIQKLRQLFDEKSCPNIEEETFLNDVHAVSSVLKMYFRELPIPLLTFELFDRFMKIGESGNIGVLTRNRSTTNPNDSEEKYRQERINEIRNVVSDLPPPNYRTLLSLVKHLNRLSHHHKITNMTARNLAIVWAPNLLKTHSPLTNANATETNESELRFVQVIAFLTETLIDCWPEIFEYSSDHIRSEGDRRSNSICCSDVVYVNNSTTRSETSTLCDTESNESTRTMYMSRLKSSFFGTKSVKTVSTSRIQSEPAVLLKSAKPIIISTGAKRPKFPLKQMGSVSRLYASTRNHATNCPDMPPINFHHHIDDLKLASSVALGDEVQYNNNDNNQRRPSDDDTDDFSSDDNQAAVDHQTAASNVSKPLEEELYQLCNHGIQYNDSIESRFHVDKHHADNAAKLAHHNDKDDNGDNATEKLMKRMSKATMKSHAPAPPSTTQAPQPLPPSSSSSSPSSSSSFSSISPIEDIDAFIDTEFLAITEQADKPDPETVTVEAISTKEADNNSQPQQQQNKNQQDNKNKVPSSTDVRWRSRNLHSLDDCVLVGKDVCRPSSLMMTAPSNDEQPVSRGDWMAMGTASVNKLENRIMSSLTQDENCSPVSRRKCHSILAGHQSDNSLDRANNSSRLSLKTNIIMGEDFDEDNSKRLTSLPPDLVSTGCGEDHHHHHSPQTSDCSTQTDVECSSDIPITTKSAPSRLKCKLKQLARRYSADMNNHDEDDSDCVSSITTDHYDGPTKKFDNQTQRPVINNRKRGQSPDLSGKNCRRAKTNDQHPSDNNHQSQILMSSQSVNDLDRNPTLRNMDTGECRLPVEVGAKNGTKSCAGLSRNTPKESNVCTVRERVKLLEGSLSKAKCVVGAQQYRDDDHRLRTNSHQSYATSSLSQAPSTSELERQVITSIATAASHQASTTTAAGGSKGNRGGSGRRSSGNGSLATRHPHSSKSSDTTAAAAGRATVRELLVRFETEREQLRQQANSQLSGSNGRISQ